MSGAWCVGRNDVSAFYVEPTEATLGEASFDNEREALVYGIACATDARIAAAKSLTTFRARLRRLGAQPPTKEPTP